MGSSTIISVLIGISFSVYFMLIYFFKKRGLHNLEMALKKKGGMKNLNLKHGIGIILFGFLFYFMVSDFRILIHNIEIPRFPILMSFSLLLVILAVISYISVQKSTFINQTLHHNKFFDAFVYFFIRFSFLLCYEFFFRGVLLYYFLEFHGLILAITFSTGLYLLIHIFDSKKELLGTIPFGIMLCVFTYLTNSIWAAFFFHLTLSAIYEISIFFKSTIKVYKS